MQDILYYIRDHLVGTHYIIYSFILFFFMFAIIGYLFKEKYGKYDIKLKTSQENNKNNIEVQKNEVTKQKKDAKKVEKTKKEIIKTEKNNVNNTQDTNKNIVNETPSTNSKPVAVADVKPQVTQTEVTPTKIENEPVKTNVQVQHQVQTQVAPVQTPQVNPTPAPATQEVVKPSPMPNTGASNNPTPIPNTPVGEKTIKNGPIPEI